MQPLEGSRPSTSFSSITLGLYAIMWAYDGWYDLFVL